MYNILEDVSKLIGIDSRYLTKITDNGVYAINSAVEETMLNNSEYTELDIGLGTLVIGIFDNEIKYKFIPSKRLESTVKDTVINKRNMLERKLESSLKDKLIKTYQDLL